MPRRLLLSVLLVVLVVPKSSSAQPITSFDPDTTLHSRRNATPPGMVDALVWIGGDVSPYAPSVSAFQGRDLHGGTRPWDGISASWPAWRHARRWVEFGFSHVRLGVNHYGSVFADTVSGFTSFSRLPALSIDEAVYRTGADLLAGSNENPWGYVGVGAGIGAGWLTSESGPGQDAVTSVQLLVRTGLLLQLTRSTRVTVGLAGVAAYELADRSVGGRIEHSELHFTLEHRLRLPKRLLPDL